MTPHIRKGEMFTHLFDITLFITALYTLTQAILMLEIKKKTDVSHYF